MPLFQLHLALSLSDALAKTTSLPVGIRAKLRCWHRLRLVLKQARYGMELLTAQGGGDPAWLSMLVSWQERLGANGSDALGAKRGEASNGEP